MKRLLLVIGLLLAAPRAQALSYAVNVGTATAAFLADLEASTGLKFHKEAVGDTVNGNIITTAKLVIVNVYGSNDAPHHIVGAALTPKISAAIANVVNRHAKKRIP